MSAARYKPRIADAEIARLIRTRDKNGAEVLYDTYARFLFLVIRRLVPEQKLAEDVLHATFSQIWCSIHDYDPVNKKIYTWMMCIAKITALAMLAEADRKYEKKSQSIYTGER